ncbi:MAG: hypothetical protein IV100_12335, partial [Myxococcales bacterium]|nr:hypothetical protein [Myxococcales bacterium]
ARTALPLLPVVAIADVSAECVARVALDVADVPTAALELASPPVASVRGLDERLWSAVPTVDDADALDVPCLPMPCAARLPLLPVVVPAVLATTAVLSATMLRSTLVLAAPPVVLDLTRGSLAAPISVELRDLAAAGARQLPLVEVAVCEDVPMPVFVPRALAPPDVPWRVDGAEADALRAAVLGVCGSVAAAVALRLAERWPEVRAAPAAALRFAPIAPARKVAPPPTSTWMATLAPDAAAKIDRKYRPLSVAAHCSTAALACVDKLCRKLPSLALLDELLAPTPAPAVDDTPMPDARFAPRTFLCSTSVAQDLSSFMRLQHGGAADAVTSAPAVTARAADVGLFGAWQAPLVDALVGVERAWLVVPDSDCGGNTDCHVLLPWLLESPLRRVVCVRVRP